MDKMGDTLYSFFDYMKWDNIQIIDKENTIYYQTIVPHNEVEKVINFDFSALIDVFSNSIKIAFFIKDGIIKPLVKKEFDKEEFKEDLLDLSQKNLDISCEISINKEILITQIQSTILHAEEYTIHVFSNEKNLAQLLKHLPLEQLDNKLFIDINRKLIILIEGDLFLENQFIKIVSNISLNSFQLEEYQCMDEIIQKNKIKFRNKLCNWTYGTKTLTPEFIFFDRLDILQDEHLIKNVLLQRLLELIICYVSDFTDRTDNSTYSILNGSKKVEIIHDLGKTFHIENVYYLYEIYKWIYSEELNTDKFYIARNLISISLCENCKKSAFDVLIDDSKELYESIINNYDKYLIQNVETYFKEKYKAKDMVFEKIEKMNTNINGLIEAMNKNIFTLVGASLVAAVTYVAKDSILILKLTGIIYAVYLVISSLYFIPYYRHKKKLIENEHDSNMEMFKKNLLTKDVPEDKNFQKSSLCWNIYWWFSLILIIIILIIDIIFIFSTDAFVTTIVNTMNNL